MKRRIDVQACSIVATGAEIVVNASNDSATFGGGVSRSIFDACGGAVIQEEMRRKLDDELDGVLEEGDCLVTSGGTSTTIRHLLHVPAVDYRGGTVSSPEAPIARVVFAVPEPDRFEVCSRLVSSAFG